MNILIHICMQMYADIVYVYASLILEPSSDMDVPIVAECWLVYR